MIEDNYIFEELENQDSGVLGDEHSLFERLKSYEKDSENTDSGPHIIDFLKSEYPEREKLPALKLAAESSGSDSGNFKSEFLFSLDGKYALKFTKKLDEEIHIRLISESELNTDEVALYSSELNKYFVSNISGDFIIGQYSKFNPEELNFKALLPKTKLTLLNKEGSITVISDIGAHIENRQTDRFIYLNLENSADFLLAVILSGNSKHIIKIDKDIIEIPSLLITEKSYIFLY
ncbi:MAG: hypothetical protein LWX07_06550 [Bacteroidetes bacterium]|nr:hypothetical protein [Bacteroidota bacterium]